MICTAFSHFSDSHVVQSEWFERWIRGTAREGGWDFYGRPYLAALNRKTPGGIEISSWQQRAATGRAGPPTMATLQNRGIPGILTISKISVRRIKDLTSAHRPLICSVPRTEPEIARRNHNQSTPAPADAGPPAAESPRTPGISMVRAHHRNPLPSDLSLRTPESRTKSEDETRKPIQSTSTSVVVHPATPITQQTRGISTIRQRLEGWSPTHQPHIRSNPQTELETAQRNRNQSTST